MMDLVVNGVPLDTLAWNVKNRSGRWGVPARRGANHPVPGVHGRLWVTGKPYDEGSLALSMWVVGCDRDGSIPLERSRQRQMQENLDTLTRLFGQEVLHIEQRMPDGTVRFCDGEVIAAIDFSSMAGGTRAEFSVAINVPGAFWYDQKVDTQTFTIPSGASAGTDFRVVPLAAATAPLMTLSYAVTGPINVPRLTDPVTDQWVSYNPSAIAAGTTWTVDAWTSTIDGVTKLQGTFHGLGATFLDLTPDPKGPRINVSYSSSGVQPTAATKLTVTGRKAYFLA